LKARFKPGTLSEEEFRQQQEEILKNAPVPVFWLFGKTGSGKTSLVRFLTGADDASIGNGFRPETQHSRQFDFPDPEFPILRFLDTRGLGEARYDPQEDIAAFSQSAHLVIVTARLMDHALEPLLDPLRAIRKAAPHRPILLALTCLHEAYPRCQHPSADAFDTADKSGELPTDLRRSLERQRERFAKVADRIVLIDLTRPEEGFAEPNFGGDRLKAALVDLLPAAFRQTILNLDEAMRPLRDLKERQAMPYILSYSTLAATAAAVPVPWIDIPVVMALQSHMVSKLAKIYGQSLDHRLVAPLAGAMSGRLLARLTVRSTFKLVPIIGAAANAALAFAYMWASGRAWCWYFGELRAGNAPSDAEVQRIWHVQLSSAAELWKRNHKESDGEAADR
jgi:uncharacterized protein (DUF697 family)